VKPPSDTLLRYFNMFHLAPSPYHLYNSLKVHQAMFHKTEYWIIYYIIIIYNRMIGSLKILHDVCLWDTKFRTFAIVREKKGAYFLTLRSSAVFRYAEISTPETSWSKYPFFYLTMANVRNFVPNMFWTVDSVLFAVLIMDEQSKISMHRILA
jgi:hypothetical protein